MSDSQTLGEGFVMVEAVVLTQKFLLLTVKIFIFNMFSADTTDAGTTLGEPLLLRIYLFFFVSYCDTKVCILYFLREKVVSLLQPKYLTSKLVSNSSKCDKNFCVIML